MPIALIIANPNSDGLGEIISRHRTTAAAERARAKLTGSDWRWSYVAARRADGTFPSRCEG